MPAGPERLIVEFPLTGGLDQSTAQSHVQPGRLLAAENVVTDMVGAYVKRFGTTAVGANALVGTAPAANSTIAGFGDRLLYMDDSVGGQLIEQWGNRTIYHDQRTSWTARFRGLHATTEQDFDADIAYDSTNNLLFYAWGLGIDATTSAYSVYVAAIEATTGAMVIAPHRLASASGGQPKVRVIPGSVVLVVWYEPGTGNIRWSGAPLSGTGALVFSSAANLVTDAGTNSTLLHFDADAEPGAFAIAYPINAGGGEDRIRVREYTPSISGGVITLIGLGPADIITTVTASQSTGIAQRGSGGWWVVTVRSNGAVYITYITALVAIGSGPTLIQTISNFLYSSAAAVVDSNTITANTAFVAVSYNATTDPTQYERSTQYCLSTSTAVTAAWRTAYRIDATSRPFISGGRICLPGTIQVNSVGATDTSTDVQGTLVLAEVANPTSNTAAALRPLAVVGPRQTASFRAVHGAPAATVQDSAGNWRTAGSVAASRGDRATVADVAYAPNTRTQIARLGDTLYISGGVPSYYDGSTVGEVSFLYYPRVNVSLTNTANALSANSTYTYAVVYRHYDRTGAVHRSAVGFSTVNTNANTQSATLRVACQNFTTRHDVDDNSNPISIEIYRTQANATALHLVPGLVWSDIPISGQINDPQVFSKLIGDAQPDANLATTRLLYTEDGTLDNVNPPSARLVCVHRNRVFLAGCPDGKEIWPSKQLVAGEAPGFNEGLVLRVDDDGDITALASMDAYLLIFKERSLFFISGDGPDNTGQRPTDWGTVTRIVSTVGCIDPRSVVVLPIGVVFQSDVGLSFISRGLEVEPDFGNPVRSYLAAYPVCVGSLLHPTLTEARWIMRKADASASIEIRYDHRTKAWTTASYRDPSNTNAMAVLASCAAAGEDYFWVTTNAAAAVENVNTYLDSNAWVTAAVELAPLQTGGTLGYQTVSHVTIAADRVTDHDVNVAFYVDGNATAESTASWNSAATANVNAAMGAEILAYHPKHEKCRTARVRIQDGTPTGAGAAVGNGAGMALTSVAFEVTTLDGAFKNLPKEAKR